jgi:DNA polymerase III subunit gamma/tau
MAQALYRKWRPQTFDHVVGQEHIIQTLQYALRTGHTHHAYLLAGPRGTGKTTTARLIAKAVNCLAPAHERPCNQCEICNAVNEGRLMDLSEIDAASNTGVDNIRDLLEKVGFRPTQATYKVYVIDEVHMLSTAAFNALLKTLEEPPEHVLFVLATTEVHKIPETILSRCQRFEFRRIPLTGIVKQLEAIATSEGVTTEPEALELIARAATGSMRDAISLLDQMAASGDITADYVRLMLGAERREVVQSLLAAWVDRDLTEGLRVINQAVDGGADPRQLARQTADYLRGLLLIRLGAGHTWTEPTPEERAALSEMANRADPDRLVDAVRRFSDVAAKQRAGWQPQLPLELAFVEAALRQSGPASSHLAVPPSETQSVAQNVGAHSVPAHPVQSGSQSRSGATPILTVPVSPSPERSSLPSTETPKVQTTGSDAGNRARSPQVRESPVSVTRELEPSFQVPEVAVASQATEFAETPGRLDAELVSTIKTNWSDIIGQFPPVPVGALLKDASVGGADSEGRLVLVFRHAFHQSRVAEGENRRIIEEKLGQIYQQSIVVRCLLAEDWQAPAVSAPARKAKAATTRNAIPAEEDELIRRAQEELGAVPKPAN